MQLKHYVRFLIKENSMFPREKVWEVKNTDLSKIQIPPKAVKMVLFDQLVGETVYNGRELTVRSQEFNTKIFYIGKYMPIEKLKPHDYKEVVLYQSLQKLGCTGVVTNEIGDNYIFKNNHYIDRSSIDKNGHVDLDDGLTM